MKVPAYVFFIAASLFASTSFCESAIIQGGALAILGWAVWYVLAKALPQERKDFLKAQEQTRHEFGNSLESLTNALDRLVAALSGDPQ